MAKLTDPIKAFIVQGLATYRTPTEVAEAVKEKFSIEIHRAQVAQYDPEGYAAGDLAKKWKDMHAATRAAFLVRVADIGIAQRAYRLRELDENYRRLKSQRNLLAANAVLEQAAKEVGEVFTNRTKIEGKVSTTARVVMMPPKDPS